MLFKNLKGLGKLGLSVRKFRLYLVLCIFPADLLQLYLQAFDGNFAASIPAEELIIRWSSGGSCGNKMIQMDTETDQPAREKRVWSNVLAHLWKSSVIFTQETHSRG